MTISTNDEAPRLTRVAIYCRVSTDDQEELGTIADQVNYAHRFVEDHDLIVYDWYMDDGVSGTLPLELRSGGARLLKDADARRFQAVYCYNMTRFARDTYVYLAGEKYLKDRGVALCFMREQIDLNTPAGRVQATMLAGFSEYERALIVERTMSGKIRVASEGKWSAGRSPYGYRSATDGKRKVLELYEPEAEVVRQLYHLFLDEGMSLNHIAKYFNSLGVPAPDKSRGESGAGSGLWFSSTLSKIIRHPAYKGEYVFRKTKGTRGVDGKYRYSERPEEEQIVIPVPMLVSAERWQQAIDQSHSNKKRAKGNEKREYLLTGIMICGECNCPYTGSGGHTRGRMYYRCSGSVSPRVSNPARCRNRSLRAERIEEAVWRDVEYWLTHPEEMQELIMLKLDEFTQQVKPTEVELAEIERALAAKQVARKKIRDMFANEWISVEEAEEDLKGLQAAVELLQARKQELQMLATQVQARQDLLVSAQVVLDKLRAKVEGADVKARREIMGAIVEKVVVEREDITIHYHFTTQGNIPYNRLRVIALATDAYLILYSPSWFHSSWRARSWRYCCRRSAMRLRHAPSWPRFR